MPQPSPWAPVQAFVAWLLRNPRTTVASIAAGVVILQDGHDWSHICGAVVTVLWGLLQADAGVAQPRAQGIVPNPTKVGDAPNDAPLS